MDSSKRVHDTSTMENSCLTCTEFEGNEWSHFNWQDMKLSVFTHITAQTAISNGAHLREYQKKESSTHAHNKTTLCARCALDTNMGSSASEKHVWLTKRLLVIPAFRRTKNKIKMSFSHFRSGSISAVSILSCASTNLAKQPAFVAMWIGKAAVIIEAFVQHRCCGALAQCSKSPQLSESAKFSVQYAVMG